MPAPSWTFTVPFRPYYLRLWKISRSGNLFEG
jgi:hypothetical protein